MMAQNGVSKKIKILMLPLTELWINFKRKVLKLKETFG